jgi:hypothetical protein
MLKITNAVIVSTSLSIEDHGLLSAWLHLEFAGGGQGFGGYALYLPKDYKHNKSVPNFAGHFIFRCLQIAGGGQWSKLPGRTIRIAHTMSSVYKIGHIIDDDWFCPTEDFKNMCDESAVQKESVIVDKRKTQS